MRRRKAPIDAALIARQKAFGEWIRQARQHIDMKALDLARKVRIAPVHLSRIENGHTGVSRDTAASLAKALGLDLRETLNRAGYYEEGGSVPSDMLPSTDRLLAQFLQLPDDRRKDLMAITDSLWRLHRRQDTNGDATPAQQPPADAPHPTDAEIEELLAQYAAAVEANREEIMRNHGGGIGDQDWETVKRRLIDEKRRELQAK